VHRCEATLWVNIDLLCGAIQADDQESAFDVDGDQVVDLRDHEFWVSKMARTVAGEANLDWQVRFADFVAFPSGFGKQGGLRVTSMPRSKSPSPIAY
jgi:hypothetical protein